MNFSTMQQELSDRVKAYDNAVSSDLTALKRWLNMAQQDISGRQNWSFMLGHEIIQTIADITTGTVSINTGSTSLTFSSAPSSSVTNYFIKFSDTNNWYKISSHTAGSTSATLSQSFGGSSNISAGTYTLRKLFYATSTPFDSILDIKETVNGRFIKEASARDVDIFLPLYWNQGSIYQYTTSVPDSTGGVELSFIYSPSSVINLQVRGIKKLSDMSASTDTSLIPQRWHSTILDLAAFYAFVSLDDTRSKDFLLRAEQGIEAMMRVYGPDIGRHRIIRKVDSGLYREAAYALPPQYGEIFA